MNQLKKIQVAGGMLAMGMPDVTISISSPHCLGVNLVVSGSDRLNKWHPTRQSSIPY
jgi:hypothetical protein